MPNFSLKDFQKISKDQAKKYLDNKDNYGIGTWEDIEDEQDEENF